MSTKTPKAPQNSGAETERDPLHQLEAPFSLAELAARFREKHPTALGDIDEALDLAGRSKLGTAKMYPKVERPQDLEPYRSRHLMAMTEEGLHSKADIADQLALRDLLLADEEEQTMALRLNLPRFPHRVSDFALDLYGPLRDDADLPTEADHTNALCVDFGFDPQHPTTNFVANQLARRDAKIARLTQRVAELEVHEPAGGAS